MKRNEKPIVYVLLSGGIDSAACVHFYKGKSYSVRPVFVSYGQPAEQAESKSARKISQFYGLRLRTISVAGLNVPKSGEIIGRNLLLAAAALMRSGIRGNLVAIGIHHGTRYYDCSSRFIETCTTLFSGYTDGRVGFAAPFAMLSKSDIWEYCKDGRVPVRLTWSCETSSKRACGKCLSCRDKERLLAGA
jgi:7-cyano-7-deazaguanine synthase